MAFDIAGVPYKLTPQDMGGFDLGAALKSGLENYNTFQEARYKPQNLQQALLSAQLQNRINQPKADYAKDITLADLAKTQAGTKAVTSDTALNEFRKQLLQAQAQQAGSAASKANMISKLYESVLNGGMGGAGGNQFTQPQQQPQEQYMPGGGQAPYMGTQSPYAQQLIQNQPQQQPQQGMQQPVNQPDLMRQNLVANLLGLKPSSQVVDGQLVTNNPLFGVSSQKVGLNPFEKQLAIGDAKQVADLENTVHNAQSNQTTLDSLTDIVASPQFGEMRQNPILGEHELGYFAKFGTPEQQNMANQYMTLTGELIKNAAKDFHGQFRVGEQALLNNMKPSTSDTVEGARAKTEAFSYMNQMLMKRAEESAKLIRQNVSPVEAYKAADKQIKGEEIRAAINAKLHPEKNTEAFVNQMAKVLTKTIPEATAENIKATARKRGITEEQVIKDLMEHSKKMQGGK